MKLGLDVDGVMYGFTHSWITAPTTVAYMAKKGIPQPDDPEFHTWNDFERMGFTLEDFLTTVRLGVDDGYIFRVGEPFEGCVDVINALKDEGHTIHIITHRDWGEKTIVNTMDWFHEYQIPFDTFTFAEDKTIVGVDLLLDDRDKNYEESIKQGIPCVLMDRDWNQHVQFAPRVADWYEFYSYVAEFEKDQLASVSSLV